jgi:hypothetical protein
MAARVPSKTARAAPAAPAPRPDEPVDAVLAAFPDEWVAVEVTSKDERGNPGRGRVAAHAEQEGDFWDLVRNARRANPGIRLYIAIGGPRITTYEGFLDAIRRAEADAASIA